MTGDVVVAGGGMAALELILALRELAGERVRVTVVAPERDLTVRPVLVGGAFGALAPIRRPLSSLAEELGFRLVPGSVAAVDPELRRIVLRGGGPVAYDTLVLAPGARRLPAFDGAIHLGDEAGARGLQTLRDEISDGIVSSVAFVAPTLTGWLLPLYEAALLTARLGASVTLVTEEREPLELFGDTAVGSALADAGIEFRSLRPVSVPTADRVVSLPLLRGPGIEGVPEVGAYRLIPVDPYERVVGLPDAYAIGDATDYPIKQGGIACSQADVAAAHIAARHGAAIAAKAFEPELRALLLTGSGEPIVLGSGAPEKIPGRYLGPFLAAAGSLV